MFYNERMFDIISGLTTKEKLEILADAAKYDVACTSSGVDRKGRKDSLVTVSHVAYVIVLQQMGRCISLLKVLLTKADR